MFNGRLDRIGKRNGVIMKRISNPSNKYLKVYLSYIAEIFRGIFSLLLFPFIYILNKRDDFHFYFFPSFHIKHHERKKSLLLYIFPSLTLLTCPSFLFSLILIKILNLAKLVIVTVLLSYY